MRKVNSFLIIALVALIGFAFYPLDNATKTGGNDDPNREAAKSKFWDTYQIYKHNTDNGIKTARPIDPSGIFKIDENGNFSANESFVPKTNITPPSLVGDAVTGYAFTQSTGTFTTINGTMGEVVLGTGNMDDNTYPALPIGFTFNFSGTNYTTFGAESNGGIIMGSTAPPCCQYSSPLNTAIDNQIVPFGWDLYSNASGRHSYILTGTTPNRVLTVEWGNFGFYSGPDGLLNFQVKLFETSNIIQFVYGGTITAPGSARICQVGIRGTGIADVNSRATTTSWAATTAGTSTSTCAFATGVLPTSGLTFQYAPPAPPATPVQVRPVYGSVGRPQTDTIQWNPSSGATFYNLQLATDTTFGTLLFSDTTLTGTQYTIGIFSPLATYWWRVRAKNAIGWSAYSPGWKFKIMGPATTPTLLLPVNNAVNQPVTITCRWSKAIDQTNKPTFAPLHIIQSGERDGITAVSNYWYELYSDTTAAPTVRDSTLIGTSRTVTGLTNSQNYWWRVKAKNNVGWGAFSSYFKFTTIVLPPPTAPTLISPPNNATGIGLTPTMIWSTVATATSYQLQVSNDPNFATTVLDSINNTDTLTVPSGRLVNGTTYYWRARGINVGGNGPLSSIFVFTVSPVGIVNNGVIPKVFKLYNAFPNPFNPSSTIKFDIPKPDMVKMVIYNMLGQEVFTLVNSHLDAGSYSITWEASNFPSDVYFYKITAGNFTDIRKIVLVK